MAGVLVAPAAAWADLYAFTTTDDTGPGSLRQAIADAEANYNPNSGPNTVAPSTMATGLLTISISTPIELTAPVAIDGQTRTVIDGSGLPTGSNAIVLGSGSGASTVNNLTIEGAPGSALLVQSSGDQINGDTLGTATTGNGTGITITGANNSIGTLFGVYSPNVIEGNAHDGVVLSGSGATGNNVRGNTISANGGNGILVSGAGATGNKLESNLVGTDASNAIAPNGLDGIQFAGGANNNSVTGGTVVGGSSTPAVDLGGANDLAGVSLGGGAQPLVTGGGSLTINDSQPSGSSYPFSVVGGPPSSSLIVDLLGQSCTKGVAQLTWLGEGTVQTNAGGAGSGSVTYSGAPPSAWTFTADGAGGFDVLNPCRPAPAATCSTSAPGPAPPFSPSATDPDRRWLQAAYNDLLGRPLDSAGLNMFGPEVAVGARSDVAAFIGTSLEYRTDRVKSWYEGYFGRAPSPQESALLVTALGGGQVDDEDVQAVLLSSDEYLARAGGTTQGFMEGLYCDLLHRPPPANDLAFWLSQLAGSATRLAVARQFLTSQEYRVDLVNSFIERFLRRSPPPGQTTPYVQALAGGATDELVIADIVGSDEYFQEFAGLPAPPPPVTITSTGVINTVLQQPATVTGQVYLVVSPGTHVTAPGHALDRGRVAAAKRPTKVRLPKLKLVGTVAFGKHPKGHVRLRWNRKVKGHKLRHGTYELVLRIYRGKKLIAISDPIAFKQR